MRILGGVALVLALGSLSLPVSAEVSPAVLLNSSNTMPACATPGRLMSFLKSRNPGLRPRFSKLAVYYMEHGEKLNVRWDFAFFQMMMETNSLKFTGDVNWSQNNFAGLGATGGGVKGESFATVSDGVRAHLEHLLIYAGVFVDDPIAERTRKVQSWNILEKWQRSIGGPMTFGRIGQKWAPNYRAYARDINSIANRYYASYCNIKDPSPELIAQARGERRKIAAKTAGAPPAQKLPPVKQAENEDSMLSARASLGASTVYKRPQQQPENSAIASSVANEDKDKVKDKGKKQATSPDVKNVAQVKTTPATEDSNAFKIINLPANTPGVVETTGNSQTAQPQPSQQKLTQPSDKNPKDRKQFASAAAASGARFAAPFLNLTPQEGLPDNTQQSRNARQPETQKPLQQQSAEKASTTTAEQPKKCRVWTASYGGQKAVIIRSSDKSYTNYTVLDVNPEQEHQETKAYIDAYAQGGEKIAEFKSQTLALDEAFKRCPDG